MTSASTSTMHVDLRPGQYMQVGDVLITLAKKDGQRARLTIQAPRDLPIKRPSLTTSAQECASFPQKEHSNGKHLI